MTGMGDVSLVLGMGVTRDREKGAVIITQEKYTKSRGPTPEWVGWTVTGPSPAEGHLPWPGVLLVGELTQVPHYPER